MAEQKLKFLLLGYILLLLYRFLVLLLDFNSLLPTVQVTPLKRHSDSYMYLHGTSNNNISIIALELDFDLFNLLYIKKYKNPYKRSSMYPNICKSNAKNCICNKHLNCQSTIISSVNCRLFLVVNNSDLD